MPEIKALEVKNLEVEHVVHAIEATFKLENSSFDLADYFEDTPQTAVARAYSLMNWAGYHADDFTKTKRVKIVSMLQAMICNMQCQLWGEAF